MNPSGSLYHIRRVVGNDQSTLVAEQVSTLRHLIYAQDIDTNLGVEHRAEALTDDLYSHDYRYAFPLVDVLNAMSYEQCDAQRRAMIVDVHATLDKVRQSYTEMYTAPITKALTEQHAEFDLRKYVADSLCEDVKHLISRGVSGGEVLNLYPSLEKNGHNPVVTSLYAEFEKRCRAYDETGNSKELRIALSLLTAASTSL